MYVGRMPVPETQMKGLLGFKTNTVPPSVHQGREILRKKDQKKAVGWVYNQSTKINVDEDQSWLQFKLMLGRCVFFIFFYFAFLSHWCIRANLVLFQKQEGKTRNTQSKTVKRLFSGRSGKRQITHTGAKTQ